jgi:hypothetical protein
MFDSESYSFENLDPGCFRLIDILPGEPTSPLQCTISEYPLQYSPKYEALSYAWGALETSGPTIVLSGRVFRISTELDSALRRLRRPDEARTFWIDAICINQTDTAERSSQVAVMKDIYRSAERVVAWLGEESSDSNRAMAFLKEMAMEKKRQLRSHWRGEARLGSDTSSECGDGNQLPPTDPELHSGSQWGNVDDDEPEPLDIGSQGSVNDDPPTKGASQTSVSHLVAMSTTLKTPGQLEEGVSDTSESTSSTEDSDELVPFLGKPHREAKAPSMLGTVRRTIEQVLSYVGNLFPQPWKTTLRQTYHRWWWTHERKIRAWAAFLRDPVHEWKNNRLQEKAWKEYLDESSLNWSRTGHMVTGIPVLYYDFGDTLDDFFDDERQADWEALDNLLDRSWWSRTWVVQEVWNSPNPIIQCGGLTLKWKTFQKAMDYQEGWDDMGYMVKRTKRWDHWDTLKTRYGLAIHIAQKRLLGSRLSDLLWNMWDRDATDPRDKVFAVLGLVGTEDEDAVPQPAVDYTKPVQQVYREVAAFIIEKDKKLDIILAANGLERHNGLPSWVPDWRRVANDQRPALFINGSRMQILTYFSGSTDAVYLHGHGYYASGKTEPVVRFSDDTHTLHARGLIFDTIAAVAAPHLDGDIMSTMEEARATVKLWSASNKNVEAKKVSEEELKTILRAGTPAPFKGYWRELAGEDVEIQAMENIMKKRRFFITSKGHLCIGPAKANKGDVVAIICGCNFPMVLRPEGEHHGLVGEAYGKYLLVEITLMSLILKIVVHENMAGESLVIKKGFYGFFKKEPAWVDLSIR